MLLIAVSEAYLISIAPQSPTPWYQMILCKVEIFDDYQQQTENYSVSTFILGLKYLLFLLTLNFYLFTGFFFWKTIVEFHHLYE